MLEKIVATPRDPQFDTESEKESDISVNLKELKEVKLEMDDTIRNSPTSSASVKVILHSIFKFEKRLRPLMSIKTGTFT